MSTYILPTTFTQDWTRRSRLCSWSQEGADDGDARGCKIFEWKQHKCQRLVS